MKIKGISMFQRKALTAKLTNTVTDGKLEICFNESISLKRLHSLWYGGNVVDVIYKGHYFHIEARGDIRANLNRISDDHTVCYVKDKQNGSVFGCEMLQYIRSDVALNKMLDYEHHKFYLAMHDNNWWECFVTDSDGEFHDLTWALSDDDLFEAINEVIGSLDEVINNLKN